MPTGAMATQIFKIQCIHPADMLTWIHEQTSQSNLRPVTLMRNSNYFKIFLYYLICIRNSRPKKSHVLYATGYIILTNYDYQSVSFPWVPSVLLIKTAKDLSNHHPHRSFWLMTFTVESLQDKYRTYEDWERANEVYMIIGPSGRWVLKSVRQTGLLHWHIDSWTKWPTHGRRHFQLQFHERKLQ